MSRWENKYVIGLTGNIAVGKSVVRQMLQHLGAYTIDADGLSHQAMAPGAPAYQPIVEMFGRFVLDDEGRIDRGRLGSIVFSIPEALTILEAIVHPVVNQATGTLISRAKQRVVVVEAIKLLEGSMVDAMDAIWVVDASPETQIKRLVERRKISEDDARKRVLVQRPQADKIARANVIIMNDGSVEETWKQVQVAWNGVQRAISGGQPQPAPQPRPAAAQSAPPASRPAAPAANPAQPPQAAAQPGQAENVIVRRGMPGNAEAIATFITRMTGSQVGRMDIMLAFGQKSYHIAYDKDGQVIGLIGWTVENLITRVDEFYIAKSVPNEAVIGELIAAIEDASRELQSEVCFIVLPTGTSADMLQSFVKNGYQFWKLTDIKFPAWREAAHEMIADNSGQALMKQLRADRVMKPI